MAAFDPLRLLEALVDHDVEFIVIGQIAAVLQGHPETTVDLDILPKQAAVNAERLADALRSVDAAHVLQRTDDAEPLGVDDQDFVGWRDVRSFDTAAGRIDVIPVAAGIGTFDDNRDSAMEIDLDGFAVLVASLDAVIASKEASGRPKRSHGLPGSMGQTLRRRFLTRSTRSPASRRYQRSTTNIMSGEMRLMSNAACRALRTSLDTCPHPAIARNVPARRSPSRRSTPRMPSSRHGRGFSCPICA